MKKLTWIAVLVVIAASAPRAGAQEADPITSGAKAQLRLVSGHIMRAAEKLPEELYAFRPTPDVRTIGEQFGHIADGYMNYCSTASGGTPPRTNIEKTVTGKADLMKALADGIAYCDQVMAAMNDQKGLETVRFYFGPTPRVSVLYFAVSHAYEHYGNLVTYMRLKNIVPPSSERAPAR